MPLVRTEGNPFFFRNKNVKEHAMPATQRYRFISNLTRQLPVTIPALYTGITMRNREALSLLYLFKILPSFYLSPVNKCTTKFSKIQFKNKKTHCRAEYFYEQCVIRLNFNYMSSKNTTTILTGFFDALQPITPCFSLGRLSFGTCFHLGKCHPFFGFSQKSHPCPEQNPASFPLISWANF